MTKDQLMNGGDAILRIIVSQGEKRLDGQVGFAAIQDARGGALVSASVALGAAAAGIAAGALSLKGLGSPITVAAIVATIGFGLASFLGLWAGRACNFHSPGWYPNDFADDLSNGTSEMGLLADFALDLQHRLSENRTALIRRGDFYNAATYALLLTPGFALVAAFLAA